MGKSFNFDISKEQPLSKLCIAKQLTNFQQVCLHVKLLPYGRITDKSNLSLILNEEKGSCSTKHAFLAEIARENNVLDISLHLGIYRMNEKNTPGIGALLRDKNLDYIPEAHTYLKQNNVILDYTSNNPSSFVDHLLHEEEILPVQITGYKENLHKSYIRKWRSENSIPYTVADLWSLREQCIANLSK